MGFGYALNESQRLFLVVLHLLTDLTWPAIARAYSVQFPVPPSQPSTGDCRTQWSRKLQNRPLSRALEAGQILPANEDALARAYLQAHGLQSLNALGQAYLNAPPPPPPQAGPAVAASVPPVPTAPIAPPQPPAPPALSAAPLPTNSQAPADTTTSQTAHDSYFWLPDPANQSQEAWDADQALQDVLNYQGGYLLPVAGNERPVEEEEEEETSFGGGPYGGYNYPSP